MTGGTAADPTENPGGNPAGNPTGGRTGNFIGNPTGDRTVNPARGPTGGPTGNATGNRAENLTGTAAGDARGNPTASPLRDPTDGPTGDRQPNDVEWCRTDGLTPYPGALAAMQARVAAIQNGTAQEQVWLVEHPPLYTAGTSARVAELSDPARFPTFTAGRGGQWTYHGPGQRVVYTMLDLTRPHGTVPPRDVRCFVHGLEEWMIRALARFKLRAERRDGRVGIWVADKATGAEAKIGAIGVRVSRWVTCHGIALNVAPDLSHFAGIVPCGISEHGVTSLAALGIKASMAEVDAALRAAWHEVLAAPPSRPRGCTTSPAL